MNAFWQRERTRTPLRRTGARNLWGAIVILAAASLPGTALAQETWIRWAHPAPKTVASFTIHVGSKPGVYDYTVDVGKPNKDADGVFQWPLDLSGDSGYFVAVSALGKNGLRSELSNEGYFLVPSSPSLGQPEAPKVESP